jgi:hypothetical protein
MRYVVLIAVGVLAGSANSFAGCPISDTVKTVSLQTEQDTECEHRAWMNCVPCASGPNKAAYLQSICPVKVTEIRGSYEIPMGEVRDYLVNVKGYSVVPP